jgi:catalase (peroxidase I)
VADQLDLTVLHQHSPGPTRSVEGFDYPEQFTNLDVEA